MKTDKNYEEEAAALDASPPVRFIGIHMDHPMFQQDGPAGVGCFMIRGGDEATAAQAYERAKKRFGWEGK